MGKSSAPGKRARPEKASQMRDHLDERQKQPAPNRRTRQKNIHKRPAAHVPQLLFLGQGSNEFERFVTEEGKHLFIAVLLEQQQTGDTSHPGRSLLQGNMVIQHITGVYNKKHICLPLHDYIFMSLVNPLPQNTVEQRDYLKKGERDGQVWQSHTLIGSVI